MRSSHFTLKLAKVVAITIISLALSLLDSYHFVFDL